MTNTNLPNLISELNEQINGLNSQMTVAQQISKVTYKANTDAVIALRDGIITNNTVVGRFTAAVNKADSAQRKATAAGISYGKLVDQNTQQLRSSNAGFAEMAASLVDGFTKGVKINNGAVFDLTEKMVATGQSTQMLNSLNANLISITGRDVEAVQSLNKINQEVSDKFLISNEKLIETLQGLQESFDAFSVFQGGVGSFGTLATELQGAAGAGAQRQVSQVLKLLEPTIANVGTQFLGGLDQVRDRIAGGEDVGLKALQPFFDNVIRTFESTAGGPAFARTEVAAAQLGLSKEQFQQSLQLARILRSGNKVQDELKKAQDEEFKNVKNAREKANKFFDQRAPTIQAAVASITPAIMNLGTTFGAASLGSTALNMIPGGKNFGMKLNASKIGRGLGKVGGAAGAFAPLAMAGLSLIPEQEEGSVAAGAVGVLGGAAQGAMMGAMLGPAGAAIGGLIGGGFALFESINANTEKTQEELKKQREEEERARREERAERAAAVDRELAIVGAVLNSQRDLISPGDAESHRILKMALSKLNLITNNTNTPKTGTGATPP